MSGMAARITDVESSPHIEASGIEWKVQVMGEERGLRKEDGQRSMFVGQDKPSPRTRSSKPKTVRWVGESNIFIGLIVGLNSGEAVVSSDSFPDRASIDLKSLATLIHSHR
jgi:hypothetical protein